MEYSAEILYKYELTAYGYDVPVQIRYWWFVQDDSKTQSLQQALLEYLVYNSQNDPALIVSGGHISM